MALGCANAKGSGNAADVAYDNSLSGLSAETVQGAIDELIIGSHIIDYLPAPAEQLQYTGSTQVMTWLNYDVNKLQISGDTSGMNSGEYTAVFTPQSGYKWFDGTTASKSVKWHIAVVVLPVPEQTGSLSYDGSSKSPVWNASYDNTKMTLGGTTSAVNAGSYNATFDLLDKSNCQWEDGTTGLKTVAWEIEKITPVVTAPTAKSDLKYTRNAQTLINAGSTTGGTLQYSLDGVNYSTSLPSGTTVGNYVVYYRVVGGVNYKDVADQTVSVSIGRATGSLSLDKNSMTLDVSNLTGVITATGTGTITAESSDSAVAEVTSVTEGEIHVTALNPGTVTITVHCASNNNYTAAADQTCSITVDLPSRTLADNTPEMIQAVARAGTGANYWSVGDKILINLQNVTVGTVNLNGLSLYAFIIGFNHNQSIEGAGIHFQFGKTVTGKDVALVDSSYGSNLRSAAGFKMKDASAFNWSNTGGWADSYMRNTICAAMFTALPAAWQNVIADATKYTDNTAGGTNIATNVTNTADKIFLLSEYEVFGVNSEANKAEAFYQTQYEYYANGNSKIKYKHNDITVACYWWLRSPTTGNNGFCLVRNNGNIITQLVDGSYGFAPAFMVA